jgi:hypothetical protein
MQTQRSLSRHSQGAMEAKTLLFRGTLQDVADKVRQQGPSLK